MSDTYGAVVIYAGEPKSAFFECDICQCKFKVRINEENQDGFKKRPILSMFRSHLRTPGGIDYSSVRFSANCPCCGSEIETSSTITEEDDEDV